MISENIEYSIYNKIVTDRPVVTQCTVGSTVNGAIHLPDPADIFSVRVYKVASPTGSVSKYEAIGPNIYNSTILGYTGYQSDITFVVDPTQISFPTGALDGEYYGIKFIATETGIFGGKTVADIIMKMNVDIEV